MNTVLWALVVGLALVMIGAIRDAPGQAPPPPIEGPVYTVTYVEVLPTSRADGARCSGATATRPARRTAISGASRSAASVSRISSCCWSLSDVEAFEAHGTAASRASMRERIHAIRSAPIDERVHVAVASGPLQPAPGGDAVYVVTHVDVIPPRKDHGLAAVDRELADASRPSPGNVRFEVVQQTSRPNHFTVVEIWKDARAVETHAMAEATRRFCMRWDRCRARSTTSGCSRRSTDPADASDESSYHDDQHHDHGGGGQERSQ